MSLLNYASTLDKLGAINDLPELSIYFTGDGHLIARKRDFLQDYSNGVRGLVPSYYGDSTALLSSEGWLGIADQLSTSVESQIPTVGAVLSYFSGSVNAANQMVFKGVITLEDGKYKTTFTDGTINSSFPSSCLIGDTYRIGIAGSYGGQYCEPGDLLICIQSGTANESTDINTSYFWTIVQTNINGSSVSVKINGTELTLYGSGSVDDFYAPKSQGGQGQILRSTGSDFQWVDPTSIVVGTANQLANALTIGAGLTLGVDEGQSYDGSVARTISLSPATGSSLGGVKIGDNISITDGVISIPMFSNSSNGVVPKYTTAGQYLSTSGWADLPSGRDFLVGGIQVDPTHDINFIPSQSICISATAGEENTSPTNISFDLYWYNIDTGEPEVIE